ncbi:arginase-like protein [Ophiostoma piceae UAMH 11346]|uniref:Arginase-like protein n=1 Tax=Ophiostoma piceae (strain UAMH 11346) TaxID=1262450 RepID=S3BQE1_OPHP1|nr:arginase-like protein [Ophiostoma piceae UAMH 11346]
MVSTLTDSDVIDMGSHFERTTHIVHKYRWPAVQLNFWIIIMLAASCALIGVFATFVQMQQRLELHVPWYFSYLITVGALGVVFVLAVLVLIYQQRLLPSIVMIGGFMLFVLWLVGLVVLSIELWGPAGSVSGNCNLAVFNQNPKGLSTATLAWMEQKAICQSWQTGFAFGLVGAVFLFWIMVMAYQVFADDSK